jgi:hypothetical protein
MGGQYFSGAIFAFDPKSGNENLVYSFTGMADGTAPTTPLISAGDSLYGATATGGVNQGFGAGGVIFQLDTATNVFASVYSFGDGRSGSGPSPAIALGGGSLFTATTYGTTNTDWGAVDQFDPANDHETTITQLFPSTSSIEPVGMSYVSGLIYVVSEYGGKHYNDNGAIFTVDPATGAKKIVHSFTLPAGIRPLGNVVDHNGVFYGTTSYGGTGCTGTVISGCGTIYQFSP